MLPKLAKTVMETASKTTISQVTANTVKLRSPSPQYMAIAQQPSTELDEPARQLLILDLNGTLVSRTKQSSMYVRPYQAQFLQYIFSNFDVAVWSTARPENVANMCRLFGEFKDQIVMIWNRTHFGLTQAEYYGKTKTVKDLERVWDYFDDEYNAYNTILLDDTPSKAVVQPYNSIHLREFDHLLPTFSQYGDNELLHVMEYLDKLKYQSNVCSFMRQSPFISPDLKFSHTDSFVCNHYLFKSMRREPMVIDFGQQWERQEKKKSHESAIQR
ncbi:HAD-like domain-containing protein [Radiomyces spectabilis]|uniref:HAD-like domain-containing protein n=1 Tax=Radiomyces spectabilis TaxID=64574 RepID=UPI00221E622C|nr:HAD-like domain-containing protein [Radiomyces spectabilis]KAI8376377.1 HAD-like domain-containing protein [Radiomyces spectabilis]